MNKLEKIKAEIKRRYNILKNIVSPKNKDYYDGKIEAYLEMLDLLISQLGPISNDLEEAAVEAFKQIVDSDKNNFLEIFKAGAEWQKEKMMEDTVDGEIYFNMDMLQYRIITEPLGNFHHGDKVKLIIIKEE